MPAATPMTGAKEDEGMKYGPGWFLLDLATFLPFL